MKGRNYLDACAANATQPEPVLILARSLSAESSYRVTVSARDRNGLG